MSQMWRPVDGVEFEIDIEDYDQMKLIEEASNILDEDSKNVSKVGMNAEIIKESCRIFFRFFDTIFGDNTSNQLFNARTNLRLCREMYDSFLSCMDKDKSKNLQEYYNLAGKYAPNKKIPQDHLPKKTK